MPTRPPTDHEVLQAQVCELLDMYHWSWLHVRRSIGGRKQGWVTTAVVKLAGVRMERGWPDLIAWAHHRPGHPIALEVKVPPDRLRPEQAQVLASLRSSGWECYVVTRDPNPHSDLHLASLARVLAPHPYPH